MAYPNRYGRRPFEAASKIAHRRIINDPDVREYLKNCRTTSRPIDQEELEIASHEVDYHSPSQIDYVIAVDSGSIIPIEVKGSQSKLAVIQFGAILLQLKTIDDLHAKPFISFRDLRNAENSNYGKLVLPTTSVLYKSQRNLVDSLRLTIYEFFEQHDLLPTLSWLLCQPLGRTQVSEVVIGRCPNPNCSDPEVALALDQTRGTCPSCDELILVTDSLQLHRLANEEEIPRDVVQYLTQLIEMVIIAGNIKAMLDCPGQISKFLFLVDGQLMIRSPTHFAGGDRFLRIFRRLAETLMRDHRLNLVAIEKSGAFVNYADRIANRRTRRPLLRRGHYLLLNNQIINGQILLRNGAGSAYNYGQYTHYGSKLIFRDRRGKIHTMTTPPWTKGPVPADFPNLDGILATVEEIKCDRYDNAILPIALINRSVSLSFNPSKSILQNFLTRQLGAPDALPSASN